LKLWNDTDGNANLVNEKTVDVTNGGKSKGHQPNSRSTRRIKMNIQEILDKLSELECEGEVNGSQGLGGFNGYWVSGRWTLGTDKQVAFEFIQRVIRIFGFEDMSGAHMDIYVDRIEIMVSLFPPAQEWTGDFKGWILR
jgi:hypothetical protein